METIETKLSHQFIRITTKGPPTRINDRMQTGTTSTLTLDVGALEKELRAGVKGEVRFGDGDRAMYASDAGNYRMVPIGVVLPKDTDDVLWTVDVCRHHGAP